MSVPNTISIPRAPEQPDTRTKRAIARLADQVTMLQALQASGAVSSAGAVLGYLNTDTPGGNTIANVAGATAFASTWTVPAGTLAAGSRLRCAWWGGFYTGSHSDEGLEILMKLGPNYVLTSVTRVVNGSSPGNAWDGYADIAVIADGSSGVVRSAGVCRFWPTNVADPLSFQMFGVNNIVSVDTTVNNDLVLYANWSSNRGVAILDQLVVELWPPAV